MRAQPILLEDMQTQQGIPGGGDLGEGVRLARERGQPVAADPVGPLHVNEARLFHCRTKGGPRFNREEITVGGAVLDGLRETDPPQAGARADVYVALVRLATRGVLLVPFCHIPALVDAGRQPIQQITLLCGYFNHSRSSHGTSSRISRTVNASA